MLGTQMLGWLNAWGWMSWMLVYAAQMKTQRLFFCRVCLFVLPWVQRQRGGVNEAFREDFGIDAHA